MDVVPRRRRIATACTLGFLGTNFFMFLRFFFPRTLFEPKTVFRIGYPILLLALIPNFRRTIEFGWFAMRRGCSSSTHAAPTWVARPTGSPGKTSSSVPAMEVATTAESTLKARPRPLDRAKVELDAEGQIVVDTSVLYDWPKGGRSKFKDPGAFLPV